MKTFKQFIQESFDSQYEFLDRGYEKGNNRHTYHFPTKDNKDKIKVTFDHDEDEDGNDVAHVEFKDKHGSLDATNNKGTEAIKVFSTVHKIMRNHSAQHPQIKNYHFLGQKGSRSRLYDKMTDAIGGQSEYGYEGYEEYNIPADRLRAKIKKKMK